MKFYWSRVRGGKRNKWLDKISDPDHDLTLTECLEYVDCLRIFGSKGVSPDGYLNEYRGFIFSIKIPLIDKIDFTKSVTLWP